MADGQEWLSAVFFSVYAKDKTVKGIRENTCYYWLSE